ncbi:DNA repair protein XRCC4-like [Salvia hispanica]|uniref:DNA repair protein XRCC4-like n=1 Tax=Salvia hispanica TaxID=49212 RepID=UPI0020099B90|nr:DNA repair protein XRCC4-like [Salvia hispanica]
METPKHTCLKLQLPMGGGVPEPVFVKGTWYPTRFDISVTDGLQAWTCHATEEEVMERASCWDQTAPYYIDLAERYLGFQQEEVVWKSQSFDKLKLEAEKCLAQSEKLSSEKSEFESEIYGKFVQVLNSKKAKLRTLRNRLSKKPSAENSPQEEVSSDSGEESEKEQVSSDRTERMKKMKRTQQKMVAFPLLKTPQPLSPAVEKGSKRA